MDKEIEKTQSGEEIKPRKLNILEKAALGTFISFMKKTGIKTVVISPDDNAEFGLKMDYYIKPVKVLTVDEFEQLKNMAIL